MSTTLDNRTARTIIRAFRAGASVDLLAEVHELSVDDVYRVLAPIGVKRPRPARVKSDKGEG